MPAKKHAGWQDRVFWCDLFKNAFFWYCRFLVKPDMPMKEYGLKDI
jgi:hypothetical protein